MHTYTYAPHLILYALSLCLPFLGALSLSLSLSLPLSLPLLSPPLPFSLTGSLETTQPGCRLSPQTSPWWPPPAVPIGILLSPHYPVLYLRRHHDNTITITSLYALPGPVKMSKAGQLYSTERERVTLPRPLFTPYMPTSNVSGTG